MIRSQSCIVLVALGLSLFPATPTRAAQSYDNCTGFISSVPATITSQGTWCLNRDLSSSVNSGTAITIAANNVILDCNHFKIGGLAAGAGTSTNAVRAINRFNTTVRNCNMRGFHIAVFFSGGGGHLVEDSSFDSNTGVGIRIHSAGSTIRNNLVIDTGGSTYVSESTTGISVGHGVDILDNTVNGVAPAGASANAYGIYSDFNGDGSINGNRIRGLASTGNGLALGIYTVNSGRGVIRDNDVQGPGPGVAGSVGIRCTSNAATARANMVAGFETGIVDCLASANIVNTN